jgi:hypothetical protein
MEIRLDGSRPIVSSSLSRRKVESLNGPATAENLGFTVLSPTHRVIPMFTISPELVDAPAFLVPLSEQIDY